eukprot:m.264154 g.264154  ORF g.264154 m.264154 type:complete len:103 (-) comp11053_c2_seq16:780-1088(-)
MRMRGDVRAVGSTSLRSPRLLPHLHTVSRSILQQRRSCRKDNTSYSWRCSDELRSILVTATEQQAARAEFSPQLRSGMPGDYNEECGCRREQNFSKQCCFSG